MSYESKVFDELDFPSKEKVVEALLLVLLNNKGVIKEFGSGDQDTSDEIAIALGLTDIQRFFRMQTIVKKENRVKTFPAWNRLLFRSADNAAKLGLVTRPTQTLSITSKKEWMLTEKGIDEALKVSSSFAVKDDLPVRTFEVQKIQNEMETAKRPKNYLPFDLFKKEYVVTRKSKLRLRGFRLAILDAYKNKCCVCGLSLPSPDFLNWEVEAAHIVPHKLNGKDDIWNGLALCHLHHWAFDVGWFTLTERYKIETSRGLGKLSRESGKMKNLEVIRETICQGETIYLPTKKELHPHERSIEWHRNNIFVK